MIADKIILFVVHIEFSDQLCYNLLYIDKSAYGDHVSALSVMIRMPESGDT